MLEPQSLTGYACAVDTATALASLTPDTREMAERLLDWARAHGYDPVITSAGRNCAEQDAMKAKGASKVGGCRSWHVHGRAFDLYIGTWKGAPYLPLGEAWERMGGTWGGRWTSFPDAFHFQNKGGYRMAQLCPSRDACPIIEGRDQGGGLSAAVVVAGSAMALGGIVAAYILVGHEWVVRS